MHFLYDTILYKPLLNALVFFYNTIALHDLGLAIIYLTVAIRLILYPLFHKSTKHQMIMQELQPEMKKIQDTHPKDKQKQTEAMMALYKQYEINPFTGFFLILIQLPILIALYQIFRGILSPNFAGSLYSFIQVPGTLNVSLLGLINLAGKSILMVGLAALAQYFQGRLALPDAPKDRELTPTERMGRQMLFLGPIITLVIFYNLPAAVGLYWLITSLISVIQQIFIKRSIAQWKTGKK